MVMYNNRWEQMLLFYSYFKFNLKFKFAVRLMRRELCLIIKCILKLLFMHFYTYNGHKIGYL